MISMKDIAERNRRRREEWQAECDAYIAAHPPKPKTPPNYGQKIFWLIILIVLAYVAFHVGHAEMVKNNPPVCLLGAHWNIWSGWSCN